MRPLLPNQSGNQMAWPRSHWPALLFSGALPRSTKIDEPGSGLLTRLIPQGASEAWIAVKIRVSEESFSYM